MNSMTRSSGSGRTPLRLAVLRRNPGFALAAMLTLALGIGGVTVIYSALRNILLDPFPYAQSERMVNVQIRDIETGQFHNGGRLTDDEFLDFEEPQDVLEYSSPAPTSAR